MNYKDQLIKYVDVLAAVQISNWINYYNIHLRITRERKTKLGDYSHPIINRSYHKISINGNLNKYAFIITFIHELAHLRVWNNNKFKRVQPHGIEWKNEYFSLLTSMNTSDFFAEEVQIAIINHLQKIKSSTAYDNQLMKILNKYNLNFKEQIFITDIEVGTRFSFRGRIFEKREKIKTRIKCKCITNSRYYTFSETTPIEKI